MKQGPSTPKALVEEVSRELIKSPDISTAILAGHQVLSKKTGYSNVLGVFPETTWKLGKEILETVRKQMDQIYIFTVINDWAELRGTTNAEEIREKYWEDPQYELKESDHPVYGPYILPALGFEGEMTRGRFSEKALQNRFSRLFPKNREACERPSCEYNFNKCSSEVVMLVRELYKLNIRRLIAFMPDLCKNPISFTSQALAQGDFRLQDGVLDEGFYMKNIYLNCVKTTNSEDVMSKCQVEEFTIPSVKE